MSSPCRATSLGIMSQMQKQHARSTASHSLASICICNEEPAFVRSALKFLDIASGIAEVRDARRFTVRTAAQTRRSRRGRGKAKSGYEFWGVFYSCTYDLRSPLGVRQATWDSFFSVRAVGGMSREKKCQNLGPGAKIPCHVDRVVCSFANAGQLLNSREITKSSAKLECAFRS